MSVTSQKPRRHEHHPRERGFLFAQNMEAQGPQSKTMAAEFEVIADVGFTGEFECGPYSLAVWEFSTKPPGTDRLLCLRVRTETSKYAEPQSGTTFDTYPAAEIAEEIVFLATLFLRRKLRLGRCVRVGNIPQIVERTKQIVNAAFVEGEPQLGLLSKWFDLARALPAELQRRLRLATRLYHQAVVLMEQDIDLSYLNLVSAIEVLSNDFEINPPELEDVDKGIAQVLTKIGNPQLETEIARDITARLHLPTRRFVTFVAAHIQQEFWDDPSRPTSGRVDPANLKKLLSQVYDQRSRTLHNGEPFPLTLRFPWGRQETCPVECVIRGERYAPNKHIPNLLFFERLVNHVLKSYLQPALRRTHEQ